MIFLEGYIKNFWMINEFEIFFFVVIFDDEFEYVNNIYFLKLDEMIFLLVIIKVCKIRSKWK